MSKNSIVINPSKHFFGWKRQNPDARDLVFKPTIKRSAVPVSVDLRPECPPVYDQGQLGSCTANGCAGVVEFALMKAKLPVFMPSRLFIYYGERKIEGTIKTDSGANIRDGIKVINKLGVPPETDWPYDISKFAAKPSAVAFKAAKLTKTTKYQAVQQTENAIQAALASGFPVVFGFTVYESFESPEVAKTGIVPMPQPNEKVLGGHCVVAVGYDGKGNFIVRNSWGPSWALAGYCLMPVAYLTNPNLASDMWVVSQES